MNSLRTVSTKFFLILAGNKGQGLVEYALVLMLIAIVVMVALQLLGGNLNNTYENINYGVTNAGFK